MVRDEGRDVGEAFEVGLVVRFILGLEFMFLYGYDVVGGLVEDGNDFVKFTSSWGGVRLRRGVVYDFCVSVVCVSTPS